MSFVNCLDYHPCYFINPNGDILKVKTHRDYIGYVLGKDPLDVIEEKDYTKFYEQTNFVRVTYLKQIKSLYIESNQKLTALQTKTIKDILIMNSDFNLEFSVNLGSNITKDFNEFLRRDKIKNAN